MYEYENNCCNNSNNVVKNISRYNMTPFLLFFDQIKKIVQEIATLTNRFAKLYGIHSVY